MRQLIQRVSKASVYIEGREEASVKGGLLIFAGIEDTDTKEDADWLARKAIKMRIFDDEKGMMNLSLKDAGGEILLISQFTLHASTKKGNRPSYIKASKPDHAIPIYEYFKNALEKELGKSIQTGKFGAHMEVSLVNDGPVTIFMDSKSRE